MFSTKTKGYLALTITCLVWGTTWVASKIGVSQVPPLQMAALRQFIAGTCFVVFFLVFKKLPLPKFQQFKWLLFMAIFMFVFANGLSTWSLNYIPTGFSALIGALYPLSVVIIEMVFFKARNITPLTFLGLLLGLMGIGIVFYENAFHNTHEGFLFGLFLSVIAMLSWSVATMVIAKNKIKLNPYYSIGWQMLISSVILFVITSITKQSIPVTQISLRSWLAILYLVAFGSLLAFVAFIYSMKILPIAISSLYAYLNPLVAMICAAIVLNEKLTIYIFWGALVTLCGVFLVNYSIKKNNKKIFTEPEQ